MGRALELKEIGKEVRRLVKFSMCSVVHGIGGSYILIDGFVHIWLHTPKRAIQFPYISSLGVLQTLVKKPQGIASIQQGQLAHMYLLMTHDVVVIENLLGLTCFIYGINSVSNG